MRLTIGMPPPASPLQVTARVIQVLESPRGVGLQLDGGAAVAAALRGVLGD